MIQLNLPAAIVPPNENFWMWQMLNPGYELLLAGSVLHIGEGYVCWSRAGVLELEFPHRWEPEIFDELLKLNPDFVKIEFHENKIQLQMAITGVIGAFTVLLLLGLAAWGRKQKIGRVYAEPTAFEIVGDNGQTVHKIPDLSLVRFGERLYNERGFIEVPALLAVEVVSKPAGLQHDLRKMSEFWMPHGTELGLVIDPHRGLYHLFVQGETGFRSFPFSEPFSHALLPGFEWDFAALWNEVLTDLPEDFSEKI